MTTPSATAATATREVDVSISKTPIPLEAQDLPTVCVLCSHNCGLRVDVADGKIDAVRADEHNPITHGYVCNKGFRIANYAHHDGRIEHPLRRKADGSFERISWDEAISEIAAKLSGIREQHGPGAIGLVGIGGQANHMDAHLCPELAPGGPGLEEAGSTPSLRRSTSTS